MKNKLSKIILAVLLVVSSMMMNMAMFQGEVKAAGTWDSGTGYWGDDITAVVTGDTLTLSGQVEMNDFDWNANRDLLTDIEHLVIGDGITSIGENAFQDIGLTEVTIADSVTSIGGVHSMQTK